MVTYAMDSLNGPLEEGAAGVYRLAAAFDLGNLAARLSSRRYMNLSLLQSLAKSPRLPQILTNSLRKDVAPPFRTDMVPVQAWA